jgi:hypothetical protein
VKLFNLTDVPTPALTQQGLANQTLVVRSSIIQPGEWVDAADDAATRRDAAHYVGLGALAVDQLPPAYVVAKERLQRAARAAQGELGIPKKKRGG